jgi:predicted transcriptional regulator
VKKGTSFNLSEEALRLLKAMAADMGVSNTAVLEMAIREMAKRRKKE